MKLRYFQHLSFHFPGQPIKWPHSRSSKLHLLEIPVTLPKASFFCAIQQANSHRQAETDPERKRPVSEFSRFHYVTSLLEAGFDVSSKTKLRSCGGSAIKTAWQQFLSSCTTLSFRACQLEERSSALPVEFLGPLDEEMHERMAQRTEDAEERRDPGRKKFPRNSGYSSYSCAAVVYRSNIT